MKTNSHDPSNGPLKREGVISASLKELGSEMQGNLPRDAKLTELEKRLMQIILRLTDRDQAELDEDVTRGICSFRETEARAKIHREIANALSALTNSDTPANNSTDVGSQSNG